MNDLKKNDDLAKYIFEELGTEAPSNQFVSNVMGAIQAEVANESVSAYKPPITKWGWFMIAASVIGVFVLLFSGTIESSINVTVPELSFDFINNLNVLNAFENIKVSNIFAIGLSMLTLFALFQMFLLKNYFSRNTAL